MTPARRLQKLTTSHTKNCQCDFISIPDLTRAFQTLLEVASITSVPVRGKSFSRLLVARKQREKSTETGVLNAESFFLRTETLASQALLEVALRGVLLL